MIVIDGVFFQFRKKTGIARVWYELLTRWQESGIGKEIVLLNRDGSLPDFERLPSIPLPALSYETWQEDRALVQEICDLKGARLFISTYYTRPERTPSVLLVHDMIPERLGYELNDPMWKQKHDAIMHARAFAAVSQNTLVDLRGVFPQTRSRPSIVVHNGVDQAFSPSSAEEQQLFRQSFILPHLEGRPYFLFVSEFYPYKNAQLFLRALAMLPPATLGQIGILFTHPDESVEKFRSLPGLKVHAARLTEEQLRLAYGSAIGLVYPSYYEGFGLPALEAMACGCPVICSDTSALPEVVGNAAVLVNPNDESQLAAALVSLADPLVRRRLRAMGLDRAKAFTWDNMASQLGEFVQTVAA